jgi:quercetin dioxygenase-like cupin family protein
MRKQRSFLDDVTNGQVDPKATFKIGPMNGREARESGLWLRQSLPFPRGTPSRDEEVITQVYITGNCGNWAQLLKLTRKADMTWPRYFPPRRCQGNSMRKLLVIAAGVAAVAFSAAFAQEPNLAPEGRGLLPRPPAATPEAPDAQRFSVGPSGVLSRTVFETDEDPNFRLIIRDFSFPPDKQPHAIALPSAAFLHVLSGKAEISVARQRMELTPMARTQAVPAGAPIEVVNSGESPLVLRGLIVEAK